MIFIESELGQTFPADLLERAARAVLDLSGPGCRFNHRAGG